MLTTRDGDPCPDPDADPDLPAVPEPVGATDACGRPTGPVRGVLKTVLPLAIGVVLVVVVVTSGSSISGAARAIGRMDRGWLGWALLAEVVSYLWLAIHLRLLAGHPANARRAAPLRIALIVFGLGNVMPAAPAEGVMMAGAALKRRRVDPRRVAVLLGCSQWFSTRALFAVASVDAAVAVALGDVPHAYAGGVLGGAAATLLLLAVTTWLSMRPRVAEVVASVGIRLTHWRRCPPAADRRARGAAWHRVAVHAAGSRRQRVACTGTMAAAWVSDGLCMYLALRAAGAHIGIEQLLLAYTAGILASNIPLIPAGLGVVETVTPLILVHYGVPWAQAVAVVLVYRLLGTLLPAFAGLTAVVALRVQAAAPEDAVLPDVAALPDVVAPATDIVAPAARAAADAVLSTRPVAALGAVTRRR